MVLVGIASVAAAGAIVGGIVGGIVMYSDTLPPSRVESEGTAIYMSKLMPNRHWNSGVTVKIGHTKCLYDINSVQIGELDNIETIVAVPDTPYDVNGNKLTGLIEGTDDYLRALEASKRCREAVEQWYEKQLG